MTCSPPMQTPIRADDMPVVLHWPQNLKILIESDEQHNPLTLMMDGNGFILETFSKLLAKP